MIHQSHTMAHVNIDKIVTNEKKKTMLSDKNH